MNKLSKLRMIEVISMFTSATIKDIIDLDVEYRDLAELEYKTDLETDNWRLECVLNERTSSDNMTIVFKVIDKNSKEEGLIKFDGNYSSWDSAYFTRVSAVELQEEVKTIYKEIEWVLSKQKKKCLF